MNMRRESPRKSIRALLVTATLTFALAAVLGLSATSAHAYKPPHSHSCGKVKQSVTYKVYTRHVSCDKGRRIFTRTLRSGRTPGNWSCELREFGNGAPGIACTAGKKRIFGVSKN